MSSAGGHSKANASSSRLSSSSSLLSREQQYKQLNDELTAKTANLVQEADAVLRAQDSVLSYQSLLDQVNTEDLLIDSDNENNTAEEMTVQPTQKPLTSSRTVSAKAEPKAKKPPTPKSSVRGKPSRGSTAVDNVAMVDSVSDFSLQKTISNIEQQLDASQLSDDDVMPAVANEMGAEAQIRFLKAKLRVMQEELDRLSAELSAKEDCLRQSESKWKELEEEKNRLQRTNTAQHTQLDKYKKMAEDNQSLADSLETQVSALKKELDAIKRNQKQQACSQSATEVRLNQAREDVQKYKSLLQKAQADAKENVDGEKKRVEQLMSANKTLERQKNELLNGFKKQLKLIDVLKRQKMHLEAARMLSFTEEEFVKALEWGK